MTKLGVGDKGYVFDRAIPYGYHGLRVTIAMTCIYLRPLPQN